jgi:hypothetical protein
MLLGRMLRKKYKTYIAEAVRSVRGGLGGKKVIEASQKWILTVVFTFEGEKWYSRWSHC